MVERATAPPELSAAGARDVVFMERALFLAERGRGRTTPNPIVGAVVVSSDGVVVGQGAHEDAGGPHAEVVALTAAGMRAQGATLYCTLEPCAHTGRTGPCVERIVTAGIGRVVAATRDPNPLVSGAGVAHLRGHGIVVDEGLCEAAAARQNAPFFSWITRQRPFVTLKVAASVDGFVGRLGERVKLTGPAADRHFHRQRAEIDAIAAGAGTIIADDPLLTARQVYRHRPLARVIFDWRLRVPPSARVFSTLTAGPVIMVVSRHDAEARREQVRRLEDAGVTVECFETRDLDPVLERLAAREVLWLLVEGGPALHTAFFAAGAVDRVQCVITPRALDAGVPLAEGVGRLLIGSAPPRVTRLGEDVLVEFDVHGTDRGDRAN